MIHYDACDLSDLIEKEYGHEFNVPYFVMEDQKIIERTAECVQGGKSIIDRFTVTGDFDDPDNLLNCLLNDLCFKGKLVAGEYLIQFDD